MRTQQKQRVETLGDPKGVKQHHWNTGAKENHQLNPDVPRKPALLTLIIYQIHFYPGDTVRIDKIIVAF